MFLLATLTFLCSDVCILFCLYFIYSFYFVFNLAHMASLLSADIAGDTGDGGFDPWVGKIPWGRKWQPTPVFLPGESHGQRSLAGYSPKGCKEFHTTKGLSTHTLHTHLYRLPYCIIFLFNLQKLFINSRCQSVA